MTTIKWSILILFCRLPLRSNYNGSICLTWFLREAWDSLGERNEQKTILNKNKGNWKWVDTYTCNEKHRKQRNSNSNFSTNLLKAKTIFNWKKKQIKKVHKSRSGWQATKLVEQFKFWPPLPLFVFLVSYWWLTLKEECFWLVHKERVGWGPEKPHQVLLQFFKLENNDTLFSNIVSENMDFLESN